MKIALPLLAILFLPFVAFAQGTASLGEGGSVSYTDSKESNGATLYYRNEALVLSAHDTDGNKKPDLWLVYQNDVAVREAHDTDNDGTPDAFFELNVNEQTTRSYGKGLAALQAPETISFESRINGEGEDLVGDLSSITIPGGGGGLVVWVILLLIVAGGAFWWFRLRRK